MKVSFSVISVSLARLKLIFGRKNSSRFLLSRNLAFSSLSVLEDDNAALENLLYADDCPSPSAQCNVAEDTEHNEFSSGEPIFPDVIDKVSLIFKNQKVDDDMNVIKSVLKNRGWNVGYENGFQVDLDEFNIIQILNDLFEETLDAALALYFFRWSEYYIGSEHTIRSVCKMIHILVSGNMNHRAVDLVVHIVRSNIKEVFHNLVLKILYETHTKREVLEIVYNMLVDCYIKENMVNVALEIKCKMKQLNLFPTIKLCNSLLKALLGSQKLELAWELVEEMMTQGISLNVYIISLFIAAYSKGNVESAWKLLLEMKRFGIYPDVVAYTIVVDCLCKMYCLERATSILFKMTQLGISLDSVIISSVVDGYCKVGKLERAITILKYFNLTPNVFVYNSLMSNSRLVEVAFLFNEMHELGFLPDCVNYTTIIGSYCKVGDIRKAFQYLGKMLKSGVKPSVVTFTLLIDTYCKCGDMEMANSLFHKMLTESLEPDVITYNALIDGYGKKGQLHKAFEVLSTMRSGGVSPDVVTYNILIHSLVKRGFVNEAKYLFDELLRRGFSPDVVTFTNVIDGLSKQGNFEEAFFVWFYMSEQHMKPDVVSCSALLNGYCRARRMEEAYALFLKMLDVGLNPDLILFNTLIHGFCSVGCMDDASSLVSMMVRQGILPNTATHRAFVFGFEKKWVKNPEESAAFKLQEILLTHGIHVDVDEFIASIEHPIS
ncbi:PPR domain-containing protein/PPR_1 domain-containing protein/PPR_2 domain-containing protein/PPR_3 domain-containing protein [Cephalotus follicularis]|uniref:PPR domain-containing protein/PPR_1 domain-containing protein/PPR_2 domain-containing protein/PPR_3 domain-containing protein n=1 Tax=Cephalotus follicularis TaxID=3775 RepID=A0A1Q3CJL3_CEPFO|nr:PPR domain-containing protein/PPR_1 domain-containing protein/PPR_2 domain-containing protein/PPR_3 domain-containing protein [Cephalotus follicularis]